MEQKILILINDAPYGTEKAYNALRLAMLFGKEQEDTEICTMAELSKWVTDSVKIVTFQIRRPAFPGFRSGEPLCFSGSVLPGIF